MAGKKLKNKRMTHSYFALKSQNEVYYQMASIFKQAEDEDHSLAKKILISSLMDKSFNISLEKIQ